MLNGNGNQSCGRSEALVTYLYGELAPAEALAFQRHAAGCTQCSTELVEFSGIHTSMAEWRAATVGQMAEPAIAPEVWLPARIELPVAAPRKSLVSLLIGFLSRSPLWAQAGMATAALAVAVLGVAYFARTPESPAYSVARSFAVETSVISLPDFPQVNEVLTVAKTIPSLTPRRSNSGRTVIDPSQVASNKRRAPRVAPAARNPELASLTKDILLLDAGDRDASMPRLSDLLSEGDAAPVEPNR